MRDILLVGGGGFLGSVARYLIGSAIARIPSESGARPFPFGTLTVNVVGCFIIGVLAAAGDRGQAWGDGARRFLFTGVLGGFTTFSAFGHETFALAREGRWSLAVANVLLQVLGGLLAVWAGYRLAS